jgi:hypothetical protein
VSGPSKRPTTASPQSPEEKGPPQLEDSWVSGLFPVSRQISLSSRTYRTVYTTLLLSVPRGVIT